MPKGRISIGVDDATGQPANAPRGPYITDEDDGTTPRRKQRTQGDVKRARRAKDGSPSSPGVKDLAPRRKGPARPCPIRRAFIPPSGYR